MVKGGEEYPAFQTASWMVTLAIVLGLLLVVTCLWNGWLVLSRALTAGPGGPRGEPALLGALVSFALAVVFGVVTVHIPMNGVGGSSAVCLPKANCYALYGNSRTELGFAAGAFLVDALLFAAVGAWAVREGEEQTE
jgi:hypothetical protein